MRSRYALRGFLLRVIKLNPEFDTLCHDLDKMHILLNNKIQGDHIPESERFVRTTKDSCCNGFAETPFKKLPIALNIGLFLVAIFWNNFVATEDELSRFIIPKVIITGRSLNFHNHFQIKFGSFV